MYKNATMRKLLRKAFSMLMTIILTVSVIGPALTTPAEVAGLSLAQLQAKYPNGSKWTSSFNGSWQCAGFARLMCYEAYGSEYFVNNGGN